MIKMEIKSLSDIPAAIFYPLKTWAEQSTGNWNILVGIGFLLMMGSAIVILLLSMKMGPKDERTSKISMRSAYYMLGVIILCDLIFPKEYMWNIFFLFKYGLAFLAGGIYLAVQYKRDFL